MTQITHLPLHNRINVNQHLDKLIFDLIWPALFGFLLNTSGSQSYWNFIYAFTFFTVVKTCLHWEFYLILFWVFSVTDGSFYIWQVLICLKSPVRISTCCILCHKRRHIWWLQNPLAAWERADMEEGPFLPVCLPSLSLPQRQSGLWSHTCDSVGLLFSIYSYIVMLQWAAGCHSEEGK